jgi:hypothetical protein
MIRRVKSWRAGLLRGKGLLSSEWNRQVGYVPRESLLLVEANFASNVASYLVIFNRRSTSHPIAWSYRMAPEKKKIETLSKMDYFNPAESIA